MYVLLRRLWIQITADRRRLGILCALLGLGFLLWARIIIIENIPREGFAHPRQPGPEGGEAGVDPSDNQGERPTRHVALALEPIRDPLEINPLYFPKATRVVQRPQDVDKSQAEQVENPEQAAARLRFQLQALVDRFKLEMVILAPDGPMARISGKRYRLGDRVAAPGNEEIVFQVQDIRMDATDRRVILAYGKHRFDLTMKTPDPGSN